MAYRIACSLQIGMTVPHCSMTGEAEGFHESAPPEKGNTAPKIIKNSGNDLRRNKLIS